MAGRQAGGLAQSCITQLCGLGWPSGGVVHRRPIPEAAMTAISPSTAPVPSWGAPRSKSITWYDPGALAEASRGISGLEFLTALRDGVLPPPPIAVLFATRLTEVERGRAVFECEPDEAAYNPNGVVHGGLVCTLADSAAGCAVQSTLEAGVGYTSIDINVTYLRPVTKASGVLRATGICVKPGRKVAYATVDIVDGRGKAVAAATSTCLILGPSGSSTR
jgi:uncharacterized protein (TIGR00369 family)